MLTKIINPQNNQQYSIFSSKGKQLLKNYINTFFINKKGGMKIFTKKQKKKMKKQMKNTTTTNRSYIYTERRKILSKDDDDKPKKQKVEMENFQEKRKEIVENSKNNNQELDNSFINFHPKLEIMATIMYLICVSGMAWVIREANFVEGFCKELVYQHRLKIAKRAHMSIYQPLTKRIP